MRASGLSYVSQPARVTFCGRIPYADAFLLALDRALAFVRVLPGRFSSEVESIWVCSRKSIAQEVGVGAHRVGESLERNLRVCSERVLDRLKQPSCHVGRDDLVLFTASSGNSCAQRRVRRVSNSSSRACSSWRTSML